MFEINVEAYFSAAHKLRDYKGKCENMHGHNWKVRVVCVSGKLNKQGMVIDFSELKGELNRALQQLDHKYLNDIDYFKKVNPTSENIAKYIYNKLLKDLAIYSLNLKAVTVWETEASSAVYYE